MATHEGGRLRIGLVVRCSFARDGCRGVGVHPEQLPLMCWIRCALWPSNGVISEGLRGLINSHQFLPVQACGSSWRGPTITGGIWASLARAKVKGCWQLKSATRSWTPASCGTRSARHPAPKLPDADDGSWPSRERRRSNGERHLCARSPSLGRGKPRWLATTTRPPQPSPLRVDINIIDAHCDWRPKGSQSRRLGPGLKLRPAGI